MATPARQFDAAEDQERLFDVVRALVCELGRPSAATLVNSSAHLDRDLGLGSLERVELLLRLEKMVGARVNERLVAEAETVEDIIAALGVATDGATDSGLHSGVARRAAASSSKGIAEGIPAVVTFQDVIRQRARLNESKTHLIFFEDSGQSTSLTFGELHRGAERVAADLLRRGIGRGDRVAIMLPTSRDFFLTFAGTLLAGATPVPVYPPFRADRVAEYGKRQSAILANAGARLLVTFREASGVASLLKPLVPSLEGVATAQALIESSTQAPPRLGVESHSDDLALLQYTSGSTGNPKGVMLTHANLLANVRAIGEALCLRSDDVGISWLPLYHDMGLIGAWLMPLYFGLPVVVLSPLDFLSRPLRWLQAFHQYHGTVGAAPNFAYELAAAKISDQEIQGLDLTSWRAALNGAEPVLPATIDRFAERFASCGFRRESLLPVYGLAEASLCVTIPPLGRGPRVDLLERNAFTCEGRAVPSPPEATAEDGNVISFISVGRPLSGLDVRIANDRGEDAGDRVEGQLWFRGPSVTQGYYKNEIATAALYPRGAEAGWVNSGDRAYRSDGEIYITGRVKDIIIHAGHNLYPHEIENAVAQVPGVRKGCVVAFGAPDPKTGTERLVVVAEARERQAGLRSEIAQAITAQVTAAIGLPPDVVEVIPPNAIPKTSSGKLQRDATKRLFLAGELSSSAPPVWLQIGRLAAASSLGRIRAALRRGVDIAYGCYAILLFAALLLPAWLVVLISPSRKVSARVTTAALGIFVKLAGWRVRVEGRENLREAVPRMFVANHTSYADIVVLMSTLGVDYHFVAKDEVRSMPFVRTFLRKFGHFSFNRADSSARLHQAEEIEQTLRRGESVFVFPEGTFTPQSGVRPFHLGAFKAGIAAQQEILPVALSGTRQLLRDRTWLPHPGRVTVTICPPIVSQSDASDWKEIVRVRDLARETISRHAGEPLL